MIFRILLPPLIAFVVKVTSKNSRNGFALNGFKATDVFNALQADKNIIPHEKIDADDVHDNFIISTTTTIEKPDSRARLISETKKKLNDDDGGGNGDDGSISPTASTSVGELRHSIVDFDKIGSSVELDKDEVARIQIKNIWSENIIMPSPKEDAIKFLNDSMLNKLALKSFNTTILYHQLLLQFLNPLNSGLGTESSDAHWLSNDILLSLRGHTVLSQNPGLHKHIYVKPTTPHIRLSCPLGSLSIQRTIIKALASSLGSNVVFLDKTTLLNVRNKALSIGIARNLLSRAHLFSALADLVDEFGSNEKYIFVLGDKAPVSPSQSGSPVVPWLLQSPSACEAVLEELKLPLSRVCYMMTSPELTTSELPTLTSSVKAEPTPQTAPGPQISSQGPQGSGPGSGRFPMFPPHLQARGFHIVLQNGTATMVPMGEGGPLMAPLRVDIDKLMSPADIPQHMAKLFAAKQKELAEGVSEEELQDLLADPEGNFDRLSFLLSQKFLSQLPLANIFQNMPPGLLPSDLRNDSTIEMNVHLVPSVPGMVPPGMVPGMLPPGMPPIPPPMAPGMPHNLGQPPAVSGSFPGFGSFFRQLKPRTDNKPTAPDGSKEEKTDVKPDRQQNDNDKKETDIASAVKLTGSVLSMFDEVVINPPADHKLKEKWNYLVKKEISKRIYKINRRLLLSALEHGFVNLIGGNTEVLSSDSLTDLLGKQTLSRDECHRVVSTAVKLQLGKDGVREEDAESLSGFFAGMEHAVNEATKEYQSIFFENDTTEKDNVTCTVSTAEDVETDNDEQTSKYFSISIWALESALCTVMKPEHTQSAGLSRLVRPKSLTREEMSNIAQDKHEKGLVSNIMLPQDIGVTYSMIGGLEEVKQLLRQCVTYPLKYPGLYSEGIASEAVKGVLLFGPPGTGKTMLAKAVATEGGATFLAVDASVIENKWLGESEKNARAVFTLARRLAPCVIYLDEVDSILSSRERAGEDGTHGTLTSVKTTLMQEWDGLRTSADRVMVIASTNRPFDLDEAVLRRLPRRIMVDLPDVPTRLDIIRVSLSSNKVSPQVNLTQLAIDLEGYSGSDIKEVCREAVVRVSHERAEALESGATNQADRSPLREVNSTDFKVAMKKLKASVDDSGRELQKVVEWNEKYGEMKRTNTKKRGNALSMYI